MNLLPKEKATIENMPELPYAIEEAVNRLRVNVSFSGEDIKKIVVLSSDPDEGKSFVAIQLWRQLAESGARSLLLDMDLRKSVMVQKYQLKTENPIWGTSYFLANDVPFENCALRTNYEHGDILPNIKNIANPSPLLEGKKLAASLDEMAESYRYVIIDAPPLNMVADGEKIASMCDGAILVVRGGVTSKRIVRNSLRQLQRAGCPVLGIVLSRVKGAGTGYYYKKYGKYGSKGYYSKYYHDKYY